MPRINILTATTLGVDLKTNPLFLGNKKLHSATNLVFDEGVIRTRPGFRYVFSGVRGYFQGAGEFRPSLGLSAKSFANETFDLAIVADGDLYVGCDKVTENAPFICAGDVNIFQAENYLIVQNEKTSTYWWDGNTLTKSPGMQEQEWNDPEIQSTEVEIIKPVANIPACEVYNDGTWLVQFLILDKDTQEPLTDVVITMYRKERVAYRGKTGADGRWSLKPTKRKYNVTIEKPCYNGYPFEIDVRGNLEVVKVMEEGCKDCDWEVVGGSVDSNGFNEQTGTFTVVNTGDIPLIVQEIESVCNTSAIVTPELPFTIPVGGTQVFTISAVDCILTDTDLAVVTNCGRQETILTDLYTACSLVDTPQNYSNTGASFYVTNWGSEPVEITNAEIFGGDNVLGHAYTFSSDEAPVTLPFTLLPAGVLYVGLMDLFHAEVPVTYTVEGLCGGNLIEVSGEITFFIDG